MFTVTCKCKRLVLLTFDGNENFDIEAPSFIRISAIDNNNK